MRSSGRERNVAGEESCKINKFIVRANTNCISLLFGSLLKKFLFDLYCVSGKSGSYEIYWNFLFPFESRFVQSCHFLRRKFEM